jgi:hypothetical protein
VHDFGKIAYLDLHKTGSSYVSLFLNECCLLPQVRFEKHDWAREDYNPDCFYFITIRNPVDLYSSLYRYGLERKGNLFYQLGLANCLHAFQSFDTFVSFCLDPQNGDLLGLNYKKEYAEELGFMSFRFLTLSLQYPMRRMEEFSRNGKSIIELEAEMITKLEIRNENLIADLRRLAHDIKPQFFDQKKAEVFLKTSTKINASKTKSIAIGELSSSTHAMLLEKEQLLASRYTAC